MHKRHRRHGTVEENLDGLPFNAEDFNNQYEKDSEEINRIFSHLFNKYPSYQGREDCFNRLFVGLYELKVFQRWSVAKVVKAEVLRRTGSTHKAGAAYHKVSKVGSDEADKVAAKYGVNLKVKRGQFLYKWIEHILGEEYLTDGKRMRRFSSMQPQMASADHWRSARREAGYTPWAPRTKDSDPKDYYAGTGAWGIPANHERRPFPTFEDTPTCVGQHTFAASCGTTDEDLEEQDFMRSIEDKADDVDMDIVRRRLDGSSAREISELYSEASPDTKCTHQQVLNRMKHLRASIAPAA